MPALRRKLRLGLALTTLLAPVGCSQPPDDGSQNAVAPSSAPAEPKLALEAPLDRAALLLAVAEAASAASLGRSDASAQRKLDGKRFEIRIRFGCDSSPTVRVTDAPFAVRFDPEERTLRIRAKPDLTLADPLVASVAGESVEAVEGFWLRRPWLLHDGCPVVPSSRASGEAAQDSREPINATVARSEHGSLPRVGVASFFTSEDSRTVRRKGRAYELTKVLGSNEQPSKEGYNLVLAGRLAKLTGGSVIACRPGDTEQAPRCVVSVNFDRVWIERPGTPDILADWSA